MVMALALGREVQRLEFRVLVSLERGLIVKAVVDVCWF